MAYIALQLFLNKKPLPNKKLASSTELLIVGGEIGGLSAIVSIGAPPHLNCALLSQTEC